MRCFHSQGYIHISISLWEKLTHTTTADTTSVGLHFSLMRAVKLFHLISCYSCSTASPHLPVCWQADSQQTTISHSPTQPELPSSLIYSIWHNSSGCRQLNPCGHICTRNISKSFPEDTKSMSTSSLQRFLFPSYTTFRVM